VQKLLIIENALVIELFSKIGGFDELTVGRR